MIHRNRSSNPSRPQDTLLQRFGATLRQYRKQRGLSQHALATSTGIRRAYISDIERGKRNIAVLMLLQLTQSLRIPSACLLTGLDASSALTPHITYDPLSACQARDAAATYEVLSSLAPNNVAALLPRLGATIRQYRQQQGLSQPALAARTGLSFGYISEIELGQRNLSVLSLIRIADALEISVTHLLAPLEERQSPSTPLTP